MRSSPLQSTIDEIVLGTTVVEREELLRTMNGTIGETLAINWVSAQFLWTRRIPAYYSRAWR